MNLFYLMRFQIKNICKILIISFISINVFADVSSETKRNEEKIAIESDIKSLQKSIEKMLADQRYIINLPLDILVHGKVTYRRYGYTSCPLTDEHVRLTDLAIAKADAIISKDFIERVQIKESCRPGSNRKDGFDLGTPESLKDYKFESVVVHEYGHMYLFHTLQYDGLKLANESLTVEEIFINTLVQLPILLMQANEEQYQQLMKYINELGYASSILQNKSEYVLSLNEYFADVFTILVMEESNIGKRDYAHKEWHFPFFSEGAQRVETDVHHRHEDVWQKTFELAQKTFGNTQLKKKFLDLLVQKMDREINRTIVTILDEKLPTSDLNEKMEVILNEIATELQLPIDE